MFQQALSLVTRGKRSRVPCGYAGVEPLALIDTRVASEHLGMFSANNYHYHLLHQLGLQFYLRKGLIADEQSLYTYVLEWPSGQFTAHSQRRIPKGSIFGNSIFWNCKVLVGPANKPPLTMAQFQPDAVVYFGSRLSRVDHSFSSSEGGHWLVISYHAKVKDHCGMCR
jgi:hypothetical protein